MRVDKAEREISQQPLDAFDIRAERPSAMFRCCVWQGLFNNRDSFVVGAER